VFSIWSISKGWLSVSLSTSESTERAAINRRLHRKLAGCGSW
jgi:hypothetical protein